MQLLHQYIVDSARRYPDKAAIVYEGKTLSYAELMSRINTMAEILIVEGLRKGDRILISLRDKIEFIVACYAVVRAGGMAVPVSETDAGASIQQIAKNCSPSLFMTSRNDLRLSPGLRDVLSCLFFFTDDMVTAHRHHLRKSPAFQYLHSNEGVDRIAQLMHLHTNDGAMIFYQGTSAGSLNGILFTHENLIHTAANYNSTALSDSNICELMTLSLSQSYGFGRVMSLLSGGNTVILDVDKYTSAGVLNMILSHGCNTLSLTPSLFSTLINDSASLFTRLAHQLRLIMLESDLLPLVQKQQLLGQFPQTKIFTLYGPAEAPCSAFLEIRNDRKKIDAVGRKTVEVELAVSDEQGHLLPQGQTGEILIKGHHVTLGYWRNETLTRDRFLQGAWFKTGDIGYLDREGYLHLWGRKEEIINSSGIKISATEVEDNIRIAYPEYEICVVGIPDPAESGEEIPVLCYIAKGGKTIIPSELSRTLSTKLEKHKIPRIVYRVDDFPKLDRTALRNELKKRLIQGAFYPSHQSTNSQQ